MPLNTDQLQDDAGFFMLFKGPPKEGKSIAAHSFPNTYTFDYDNKIRAIKNWVATHPELNYPRTHDYDTYLENDALLLTRKKCEEFKNHCPYNTIIVDGVTEAANKAMSCMIAYRDPDWEKAGLTKATNKDKTIRAGVPMTEIEDFNGESRFLSDLIDDLRVVNVKHKVNVIVIAHVIRNVVRDMQGREVSSTKRLVTMGNKIGESLPGKFEEVFHFERETSMIPGTGPQFMCYTQDTGGNGAGTTLPLEATINWTNRNFYNLIIKKIRKEII